MHRETRAANYLLISFSIVSLTLLSLPLTGPVKAFKAAATYILTPIPYVGDRAVERFADAPGRLRDLIAADMDNQALKTQLKQVDLLKGQVESLTVENGRLRAALGLKSPQGRTALWAHVLERDPLHWYSSVTVDAGADEGVALNSPVLGDKDGKVVAIGRVTDVRAHTAVVLLLTDELSSAAAYVVSASSAGASGEASPTFEGLVQGQGRSRMRMNYLSPDAEVRVGDLVYTSPTSATFPPDVLLGSVSNVYSLDPFLAFQSVEVRPAVVASSLDEVMILKQASVSAKLAETARAAMEAEKPADSGDQGDSGDGASQ